MPNSIDIVYPLGRGSQWRDNELRYSLRSLEMYGVNVGKVYMIGTHLPEWCINVTYIKQNPLIINYHSKISIAYREACNHVGENFVIMNDDFWVFMQCT